MSSKKIILTSIVLIFLGLLLIFSTSVMRSNWTNDSEDIIFTIDKGESVINIANNLKEKEVFTSEYPFLGYLVLTNNIKDIQAGTYRLSSEMNVLDLVSKFTNGEVEHEMITIIEGWNLQQIVNYFEDKDIMKKDNFLSLTGLSKPQAELMNVKPKKRGFDKDYKILKDLPKEASLEGYLFPDTYRVTADSAEEVIAIMIENLETKMKERGLIKQIEDKEISIHETIIMASLIEREVSKREDMRMVSDILWRRLEAEIPLQIDATINYITGRKGIEVTSEETEINSPFNTYQNTGLPKGPISNPSIESIEAVLNPEKNNFWYYLSDPKTKTTIFSKNHLEHINAKNKYLR